MPGQLSKRGSEEKHGARRRTGHVFRHPVCILVDNWFLRSAVIAMRDSTTG
jgi:hypothetical protein